MSSNFIGSKIAIITKSQCRYTGTIIGIDTQASSIILGNVKCYGTENRIGNFLNSSLIGTIVPIMQFANSDIEDLQIVAEEINTDVSSQSNARLSSPQTLSIHDDPAIVSAVISSTSNQLNDNFQQLNLSDQSTLPTQTGEMKSSWPSASSSSSSTTTTNRSKLFDDFTLNNSDRSQQQQQQQQNAFPRPDRTHYANMNYYARRGQPSYPQRRFGNRETFHDNGNNYDDEFDFETSNQKFTKITSEEELQQQQQQQQLSSNFDDEYEPIYDKKKSFFDNMTFEEPSDTHGSMYNRSKNYDTFGYQRSSNRGQFYRRANPNQSRQQQQQGNNTYHYRQNNNNNNGYHYRY